MMPAIVDTAAAAFPFAVYAVYAFADALVRYAVLHVWEW